MNKFLSILATLFVAAFLLSSCEEVPQAEMDAAKNAVNEAKTAQADVYVTDSFNAVQDSLNSVLAAIEEENSKFFKKFGPYKEKLAVVTQTASTVKQASEDRKVAIKVEIDSLASEIAALVASGRALADAAPKGKEGASAIEAIKAELVAVETSAAEATAQAANGELLVALDKSKAAKDKAAAINAELQTVIDKYKTAKRK